MAEFPYPRPPTAGSNGLGLFEIGESQIGTIPPFQIWQTVISQYANAPILLQLIENIFAYLDPTANLDAFYDCIFNVDTATGQGLTIWGEIVGVNRVLQVEVGNWLGFTEAGPSAYTFGQGAFYSGAPLTSNYALSDDAYRQLIFAKAAANITNGSIPAINQILRNLFPHRGNCYVTDGYQGSPYFGFSESVNAAGFNQASFYSGASINTMIMAFVFEFPLTAVELAIVQNSGVLPKSTGVSSSVVLL